MRLSEITPLILSFNEEDNLRDTLERLSWAKRIVVIDSYSTDATLSIIADFEQVAIFQRAFDHFAEQCNFGLEHVESSWVLSIDSDYKCTAEFVEELRRLDDSVNGFEARFKYLVYGRPLRATLYPPRVVLYRADQAQYVRDGHAHRVQVHGALGRIETPILHDDWKPLSSWLQSQLRYAQCEADKLLSAPASTLDWKDKIRTKIVLAPALTLIYCLIAKCLLLDGWPGIFYSFQRTFAELVLSLVLLDRFLRRNG